MIDRAEILSFPSVPIPERYKLPTVRGVYFVFDGSNKLLYVGKATDLRKRWREHSIGLRLASPMECRIAWVEMPPDEDLDAAERSYIRALSPELNRKGVPRPQPSIFPAMNGKQLKARPMNGQQLKVARAKLGMTQSKLAEKIGLTKVTIARYESGKILIPQQTKMLIECLVKDLGREEGQK